MPEQAIDAARLQLVAECDQRWAQAREWLWDQDALVAAKLERLLTGGRWALVKAMAADGELADVVQHLAALAMDELLARGAASEG